MHGWTENRIMNIGRINAKKLLAGFRLSRSNPYMISRLFRFTFLSDYYWMKDTGETFTRDQISLIENPLEKAEQDETLQQSACEAMKHAVVSFDKVLRMKHWSVFEKDRFGKIE